MHADPGANPFHFRISFFLSIRFHSISTAPSLPYALNSMRHTLVLSPTLCTQRLHTHRPSTSLPSAFQTTHTSVIHPPNSQFRLPSAITASQLHPVLLLRLSNGKRPAEQYVPISQVYRHEHFTASTAPLHHTISKGRLSNVTFSPTHNHLPFPTETIIVDGSTLFFFLFQRKVLLKSELPQSPYLAGFWFVLTSLPMLASTSGPSFNPSHGKLPNPAPSNSKK